MRLSEICSLEREAVSLMETFWHTTQDRVHAESLHSSSFSQLQTVFNSLSLSLSLTSQRLLNSLCSMRSSSLVSLLTMVAWRGVLSRIDSPNAVPIPSVQIVTASCAQTQHICLNYCCHRGVIVSYNGAVL